MKDGQLSKIESSPVALADMTTPQLAESYEMLDRIAAEHDNAHTICRILQGLVLLEVKRKLPHGGYGDWLKKHFKKSQDTAGNCMRAGRDFVAKLSDPKFRSTSEFDEQTAVDLLRGDLRSTLERLDKVKLDLAHPVVRAAALYAKGRSFYQLCLELGPASKGGKTYDRGGDKGKRAAFEVKAYRVLCVGACAGLRDSAASMRTTKTYRAANHSQLVDLIHALDQTSKELREWFDKPAADRDLIFAQQLERIARSHSSQSSRPKTKKKK
jgi:hypothetical protein